MQTTIKNFLYTTFIIFILSSCGKKAADVLIPEDAAIVVHLNMESLSSKLTWDDIKNSDWFKMAAEEGHHSDIQKKLLANPDNSGVDLKSDLYMFVHMRGNKSYVVVQGKLKDAKAFESIITKMDDQPKEIKKQGNFSYTGDDNGCATWTNDRFIIVGNGGDMQASQNPFENSKKVKITIDSLLRYAKDLYSLPQKSSISNDSRYASIAAEKGDIHFWLNSGLLMKNTMAGALSMFKAVSLLEGNVTGYTVNFDNGKITANTKTWFNKEMDALMKKYKPGNINTDMLKRIPGQDMSVVFAMNYPPEGLKEFLKLFGVDGMVNGFMGEVGLSIDDFVKANKGDLLFAVSDFKLEDKEISLNPDLGGDMPSSAPQPGAKILFATSINDKPSFDKMVDVLKTEISKQGGGPADLANVKYTIKDNWFIAGNELSVEGFASGNTTDHPFISKISGHPMGCYIDFQKISSGIKTNKLGGSGKIFTGEAKVWENMLFYGGEMKDGAYVAFMEVNMFDKNTNSLKQMNSFFNTVAKSVKEDMNSNNPWTADSSVVKPHGLIN